MSITRRRVATLAGALACAAASAGAIGVTAASAAGGQELVQVGKLSDGVGTGVNPGQILAGLNINQGAGGAFGVQSTYKGDVETFSFPIPTGLSVASARVWPSLHAGGWPAMGTWGEITSAWGDWNVGGNPGEATVDGMFVQGGGGLTTGSAPTATATMPSFGSGNDAPAYFQADKLDLTLTDNFDPEIDAQPNPDALLGAARASGWYTADTLNLTATVSDKGAGVRYLLLKDATNVTRYPVTVGSPTCKTFDTGQLSGNSYIVPVPCPTASTKYTVPVDVVALGDGSRTVRLGVQDAAGNQRYSPTAYTLNSNATGGALPDGGSTGPGGCIIADDGTCPITSTTPPVLSGTPQEDKVLTTSDGVWGGASGVTFAYAWERCPENRPLNECAPIAGASAARYTVKPADIGSQLRSKVTASVGGSSTAAYSTPSGKVAEKDRAGSGANGTAGTGAASNSPNKPGDDATAPEAPSADRAPAAPVAGGALLRSVANGEHASREARLKAMFVATGTSQLRTVFGQHNRLGGTLRTAGGTPIAGATLQIFSRNAVPGAKTVKNGTATTDRSGRYVFTVARGPSRVVTVSYTAYSTDARAASSASARVRVPASITLVVAPRRVRVHRTLTISGRLRNMRQGGVQLRVEALDVKKWRSFGWVKTKPNGTFAYHYAFRAGAQGRVFYFRVVADSPVYPFEPGASRAARITVAR